MIDLTGMASFLVRELSVTMWRWDWGGVEDWGEVGLQEGWYRTDRHNQVLPGSLQEGMLFTFRVTLNIP